MLHEAKPTRAQKRSSAAVDFLLHGRFARESWRAGAADTGRDKAEEGGIPAVVFRPTTTQDMPASVRLRACASRASRPIFLLKRKEAVRFVLQVGESDKSAEKKLSRSRFSFASFLLKRKEEESLPFLSRKKRKPTVPRPQRARGAAQHTAP